MSTPTELALGAREDAIRRRAKEREAAEAERAEREAAEDAEMLAWAVKQMPFAAWFAGCEWELVTRNFPQRTAVLRSVDDPKFLVIVSENCEGVLIPRPWQATGSRPSWLVGARRCRTLAEVGQCIYDDKRASEAGEAMHAVDPDPTPPHGTRRPDGAA